MTAFTGRAGAVALLAGVFLAGGLTGAASLRLLSSDAPTVAETDGSRGESRREGGRRSSRRSSDRYLKDLTVKLELSQDQQNRVAELVAASRERSDSLYHSIGPSMRQHLQETRDQIRDLLTDEQRERFDAINEERRRRGRSGSDRSSPGRR